MNIYSGTAANPNGVVTPAERECPALYYPDPPASLWVWSVTGKAWSIFAIQQVYGGAGAPVAPPENPAMPAVYVDSATQVIYQWTGTLWK